MNRDGPAASPGAPGPVPELLARYPVLRPPVSTASAAVTIVLRSGSGDVEALLIERAANPKDPASGDVSLPGGHVDEEDGSLAVTALRELREEVGLDASDLSGPLRFVGATAAPRFGVKVGVFAAELSGSAGRPSAASPEEVAHVFWLPRRALGESRPITREGPTGPRRFLASVHDGHVVWGFTRRVLREFFALPAEELPERPGPPPEFDSAAPRSEPRTGG